MMEQSSLKKCVDDSAVVAAREVNNQCDVSHREAFVAMMQATDLRDGAAHLPNQIANLAPH